MEDIYHLHAISVHSGTINSGHYYCFIRPTVDDKWYKFNDRIVSEIE
jgi:ubiquitin carboxyl-terminal hydrolase 7